MIMHKKEIKTHINKAISLAQYRESEKYLEGMRNAFIKNV